MVEKRVLILVLVLLLAPSVLAFEISDARVFWGNNSIEYFSANTPLTVNLGVEIVSEDIRGVRFNISDVNDAYIYNTLTSNYDSLDISRASCDFSEGVHSCVFRNIILQKSSPEIVIEAEKDQSVASATITLQETSANPEVTFIGTENCYDDRCYIRSGNNDILLEFSGSDAGFSRGLVAFRAGSYSGFVSSCEGESCVGGLNINCDDGQQFSATLSPYRGRPSSDDAGREISSSVFYLICDSSPPVVEDLWVVEARDIGVTEISESFTVRANVSDRISPIVDMKVIGDNVNSDNVSGSCNDVDGVFHCSAQVRANVEERGSYVVPVIFSDASGNEVESSVEVDLVEIDRSAPPDFWSVSSVKQSTDSMTIRNMGFRRDVFLEVSLSGNADLLRATVSDFRCVPVEEGVTGERSDVQGLDILRVDYDENNVYLKFSLHEASLSGGSNRYSDFSTLEYECGLDLSSKHHGFFYSEVEKENFTIVINLEEGHTLDKYIMDRIEDSERRIEGYDYLTNFEKGMDALNLICQGIFAVDSSKAGTAASQVVLEAAGITAGAARALGVVTDSLDGASDSLVNIGSVPCELLTCKSTYLDELGLGVGEIFNVDSIAAELGASSMDLFDPYRSEIVAYATACVPAWIYHQRVKQGIECNYLECLNSGIREMGFTVEQCERNKAYDHCLRQAGNVFYMLPFSGMFSDLASDFSNLVGDPANLIGGAVSLSCRLLRDTSSAVHGGCVLTQSAMSIPAHYERFMGVIDQMSRIGGVSGPVDDICAPSLSGISHAIKMEWDRDKELDAFGSGREFFGKSFANNHTISGNAVRCLGMECYIYDGDDGDAELVGKSVMGIDELRFYDDKGKLVDEFEDDWFSDFSDFSRDHRNDYFKEYESNHPEAFAYTMNINRLRSERSERLKGEEQRLGDVEFLHTVLDDMGRRSTWGDFKEEYFDDDSFLSKKFDEKYGKGASSNFLKNLSGMGLGLDDLEDDNRIRSDVNNYVNESSNWANFKENLNIAFNEVMEKLTLRYDSKSSVALVRQGARGVSTAADLFGWDDRRWADDSVAGQLSNWVDVNIAQPERAWCDRRISSVVDPVSGGDGAVVTKSGGGTVPGAYINARRSTLQQIPGEDGFYDYWIEGGINTPKDGLRYKIYAYKGGERFDYTEKLLGDSDPITSGKVSFGGFGGASHFVSEVDYDRVCIYFNERRLSDYFHLVSLSNNELCQRVVSE